MIRVDARRVLREAAPAYARATMILRYVMLRAATRCAISPGRFTAAPYAIARAICAWRVALDETIAMPIRRRCRHAAMIFDMPRRRDMPLTLTCHDVYAFDADICYAAAAAYADAAPRLLFAAAMPPDIRCRLRCCCCCALLPMIAADGDTFSRFSGAMRV